MGPVEDNEPQPLRQEQLSQSLVFGSCSALRGGREVARLATSVCQLRHDRMEQGPTEPHAGRRTFLLSSGGAKGGYY